MGGRGPLAVSLLRSYSDASECDDEDLRSGGPPPEDLSDGGREPGTPYGDGPRDILP